MKAIEVENLSKRFGGVRAVEDVSLSVEVGEFRAIIGPNGAGKTTFLNLVGGLYGSDSGRIRALGRDITHLSDYQRVAFGISRTFQITSVFPDLPVMENILLAIQSTKPYRFGMLRPQKGYRDLLEKARLHLNEWGLWGRRSTLLKELSYGEQRKVELIMGLAPNPKILLLDEPTCGLTPEESADFAELITTAGKDITLLIVEHDMDIIFKVATRITVLYHGTVLAEGTPREIAGHPKVREVYLGTKDPLRP
jgi:branched-chain amino acid transport system ATP-binding protein